MKKTTLMLMTLAIFALQSWAAPVDESTARSIAQRFLNSGSPSLRASGGSGLRLLHVEMGKSKVSQPVYYIFNTSTTFLVIAGDDRAEEVLMVGDRPLKDINNLAPGMKDLLGQYKEEIEFLHDHPGLVVEKNTPRITSNVQKVYGPLLTALWDQDAPFWDQCVFDYDGTFYQCYTGCPATSSAQVLYYWKYPTDEVAAIDAYTSTLDLTSSTTVDYEYPELPATTFDWGNMLDYYGDGYTTAQGEAVATLMRYVGQAVEMMYGSEDAGGSGIYSSETQKLVDMFTRFGYDASTCQVVLKSDYTEEDWAAMIQQEMIEGRPVVYIGVTFMRAGHAFNVDGYDGSVDKYHVNFGWSGIGNAWCAMNSFAYSGYTFSRNQQAVIGIQPPGTTPIPNPEMTVAPSTLSFRSCLGQPKSKTFTVTASDLTGNLRLTLNDPSGAYSIDKTRIRATEAANGATVTVTYNPTVVGSSSASVTISGGDVEPQTVALEGEALEANVIYTDVSELMFEPTYTGYASSATITITGFVSENIELSWYYNRAGFGLSKWTITPEQAANGAKVTVYFQPTWYSITSNRLLIKSAGAETVTIPVSGTKIKSDGYISAWPSNLSFETEVGTPVTKTFRVHYSVSNGNDAVMISDPDGEDMICIVDGGDGEGGTLRNVKTIRDSLLNNDDRFRFEVDRLIPGFPIDSLIPIGPLHLFGLELELAGDKSFTVTPSQISMANAKAGYDVTVTYNPARVGTHEATITIKLFFGSAKPITVRLQGTATAQSNVANSVEDGDLIGDQDGTSVFEMPLCDTEPRVITNVDELMMAVKIYAEGRDIVIESPVEQSAVISDIAGRARRVNLQAGRNVIPANGGVHIVRVGDKTAKLLLK